MVRPKVGAAQQMAPWRKAAELLVIFPLLVLSLATLGCQRQPPTLQDLPGVDALKAQFNADAGKPRIVLLLSPT